ncbi:hypothetical protein BDDG_03164 [Blastomyces dermatitidis ATCC 18188]|uniref:Uncharacterized protein n=1 Tax=Ajellomyces dermatitidis (strain ATCC 18188 / CBS 674.68) TaxID=653446 RepID=F2TAG0_AJEDA|nr:hypothetical protein BDDG_03164 [Blastomyces dermatitidis ATCC 18188]
MIGQRGARRSISDLGVETSANGGRFEDHFGSALSGVSKQHEWSAFWRLINIESPPNCLSVASLRPDLLDPLDLTQCCKII